MWRFVGAEKGMDPIPGIPLDASDEVFEAAVNAYEAQFADRSYPDPVDEALTLVRPAVGSVKASGLYEHISDRRLRREQAELEKEAAEAAKEGE
jgi:hypothetical protein